MMSNCLRCNATNSEVRMRLIPYPSVADIATGASNEFDEDEYMGPYCDSCWKEIDTTAHVAAISFMLLVIVVMGIISHFI